MSAKFGYNAAKKIIETALIDLRAGAVTGQPHVCPNLAQFDNQTAGSGTIVTSYWNWKNEVDVSSKNRKRVSPSSTASSYFPLFPRLSFTPDYIQYVL